MATLYRATILSLIPDENSCAFGVGMRVQPDSLGLPIEMKFVDGNVIFIVDQHCCCLECSYAFAKHLKSWNQVYQDPHYMNTEQLILCMYRHMYPSSTDPLTPRADWWLYEGNGGPLSKAEYHSNSHVYRKSPNIIFKQIKREYVKYPRPNF